MRVTIIPIENRVSVQGASEFVDCSAVEPSVRAVQWYGDHGEIEYESTPEAVKLNEGFIDFSPFRHLFDAWEVEARKNVA